MKTKLIIVSGFILLQSCTNYTFGQLKKFSALTVKPLTFNFNKPNIFKSDFSNKFTVLGKTPVVAPIAPNFYVSQLKSICKMEYKIQKTTKIPFYFRLGSLNYTNYLEGKNKAYWLQ